MSVALAAVHAHHGMNIAPIPAPPSLALTSRALSDGSQVDKEAILDGLKLPFSLIFAVVVDATIDGFLSGMAYSADPKVNRLRVMAYSADHRTVIFPLLYSPPT